jgi:hypothetical protein
MLRRKQSRQRRGVVLLVILSLLVLFALLGITFVIVSGQYERSAGATARSELYGGEPSRDLDTAMYIALRDDLNALNPLRSHSLLYDIYGHEIHYGSVTTAASGLGGNQFVQFDMMSVSRDGVSAPASLPAQAGYFNGCVLTFFASQFSSSDKVAGVSARVVGYQPNAGNPLQATVGIALPTTDDANSLSFNIGDRFIINGRPFSGAGAGFNPADGTLKKVDSSGLPAALQPNRIGESLADLRTNYLAGNMNESWDAADLQNMFLSATIPDPTQASGVRVGQNPNNPALPFYYIIPSFHRPALIRQQGGTPTMRNTLRPIPGQTAQTSFPALLDYVYGPWDVDNNGDGIPDSVWINLNSAIRTSPTGQRYRALYAYLIEDLDGRLNLNYHGSAQHINPAATDAGYYLADGTQTNAYGLKGSGLGPPEVNLQAGLYGLNSTQYTQLLAGNGNIPGRYGPDGVIGNGAAVTADLLSQSRFFQIPGNYFSGALSSYMSTPDLAGQLTMGVDTRGQLITDVPTDKTSDLRNNVEYRTRLPYDRRFTPAELERILRLYDIDAAQLPARLQYLSNIFGPGGGQAVVNRQNVTTDSYDLPMAHALVTKTVNTTLGTTKRPLRDPMDLLRQRFGASMISEAELLKLVDRDFYFGVKMNLNRPFGDGQDNNNNKVVDESLVIVDSNNDGQITAAEVNNAELTAPNLLGYRFANGEDLSGDGVAQDAADDAFVRHQFAKHLYILASLCVDTGNPPNPVTQRQLAQWAINVVDFRDADSIMTPFEYDPNPFDGWNSQCNGILSPGEQITAARGLVWGCERPELLLTETLAWHDRRTTDTADEDPVEPGGAQTMKGTTQETMMNKKDDDYDQEYMPEGAAWVEIFNPWQSKVERQPAEFYNNWTNNTLQSGVRLDQMTPGATGSPVWRILFVTGNSKQNDPDETYPGAPMVAKADKDRSIYFVDPTSVNDDHGKAFFPGHSNLAPLMPGRYAVVGSGPTDPDANNKYVTYAGFRNDATIASQDDTILADTRRLELTPNSNPATNQFRVYKNDHPGLPEPNYGTNVQPVVAVVVNRSTDGTGAPKPERFTLSEPADGYTLPGGHMKGAAIPGGLIPVTPVKDKPLDLERTDLDKDIVKQDGTHPQFRFVHLQRLANPLMPHDKVLNPYLTIDTTAVDLTVFNGVGTGDEPGVDGGPNKEVFETLERGEHAGATVQRELWRRVTLQNYTNPKQDDTDHRFPFKLRHTLGYLNEKYHPYQTTDAAALSKGDPQLGAMPPFPWLTWNNRPFNSVYEIMEVPFTRSSQLTQFYRTPLAVTGPYNQNQLGYQYGHLFNFYYDPQTPQAGEVHALHRIFDFLRIPSHFIEADTLLSATNFQAGDLANNPFHPPHNWLTKFRDPGLVNINTIYSEKVWNAVLGGDPTAYPELGPTFSAVVDSRRGYGAPGGDALAADNNIPEYIANPFRAAGTGKQGPIPAIDNLVNNDIDCTLLRRNVATQQPLLGNNNGAAHNNSARNPYFRHRTLQRLSNTVTTRSNVYAMWITVGYFEVDANGLPGQELGADTGEIQRHRAFYIIDRSIPVGFEPGENHNVDRAILVRRFIE